MGRHDWYRKTTWDGEDKKEFFARLRRSRSDFSKAQYLRIQALSLQRDACPPRYQDALELLECLFKETPHAAELAAAYLQKAQCLEGLGQLAEATAAFRAALEAEKNYPGVKTGAPLDFAMFAVRHGQTELYDEVLATLPKGEMLALFPIGVYQASAAMAIIAAEKGRRAESRQHALRALEAAGREHSGLRYHPTAGLVRDIDPRIHSKLEKLAAAR